MGGMETVHDIVNAVGRDAIKHRFGVQDRVIQSSISQNRIAASWFAALEEMTGQPLPRHLFSFKGVGE